MQIKNVSFMFLTCLQLVINMGILEACVEHYNAIEETSLEMMRPIIKLLTVGTNCLKLS